MDKAGTIPYEECQNEFNTGRKGRFRLIVGRREGIRLRRGKRGDEKD
jgi:hypothetical protein